ncbi:MAG: hypothetical protein IPH16_09375 [Haliscomenobacter sp.]|nr:hypothetical protein [Haliscomenobacter sp.]
MIIFSRFLFLALLPASLSIAAQAPADRAPVPARILDASFLFPQYRWELDVESSRRLSRAFGESKWQTILRASRQEAWPPGLRKEEDRAENRGWICDFNVYYLGSFSVDKALLWFPEKENQHLPAFLRPQEDLYFIIRESGLEKSGQPAGIPLRLEAQLDFLLAGFLTQFASIAESAHPPALTLDGEQIPTRFMLEGARTAWISRSFDRRRTSYTAAFPEHATREAALNQYKILFDRISAARFSSCPLVRDKNPKRDLLFEDRFFAFDMAGDMDPRFKGLALSLELVRKDAPAPGPKKDAWYCMLTLQN